MSREQSEAHSPDPNYKPGPFKEEAEDMGACQQRKRGGRAGGRAVPAAGSVPPRLPSSCLQSAGSL